jgi:hypothetical protein
MNEEIQEEYYRDDGGAGHPCCWDSSVWKKGQDYLFLECDMEDADFIVNALNSYAKNGVGHE